MVARNAASGRVARTSPQTASSRAVRIAATPAVPTNPSASATGRTTTSVTWTDASAAPTRATSFRVERSPAGAGTWVTAGTTTTSPFADSGLTADTDYDYRIVAVNQMGESAPSTTASVTTDNTPVYDSLPGFLDRFRGETPATTDAARLSSWASDMGVATTTQATSANRPEYDAVKGMVCSVPASDARDDHFALAGVTLDRRNCAVFFNVELNNLRQPISGYTQGTYFTFFQGTNFEFRIDGRSAIANYATWGRLQAYDGTNTRVSASIPFTSRCLIGIVCTATEVRFYVNGAYTTTAPLAAGSVTLAGLLGSTVAFAAAQGGYKDVLFYTQEVTDADVQAVILPLFAARGAIVDYDDVLLLEGDSLTTPCFPTMNRSWVNRLTLPDRTVMRNISKAGGQGGNGPSPPGFNPTYTGNAANITDICLVAGKRNIIFFWAYYNDILGGFAYTNPQMLGYMDAYAAARLATGYARVAFATQYYSGAAWQSLRTAMKVPGAIPNAYSILDLPTATAAHAGGSGSSYFPDGIHPNDAGTAFILADLQPGITAILA